MAQDPKPTFKEKFDRIDAESMTPEELFAENGTTGKAVKVNWIDSCASNMAWIFPSDLDGEVQPIHITTYGVIVQDNEDTIVVAQNYGTDPEQFCSLMTIPKGCIKEIVEI